MCHLPVDPATASPSRQYRLIFMDIQMPVMDGYQATTEILRLHAQRQSTEPLYVVAVTSFTNQEAKRACVQAGMSQTIHKPISMPQIKQLLDKYYFGCG